MSGDTPLIIAARNGRQDIVELLLNHGADLTLQNDSDESALDMATPSLKKNILGGYFVAVGILSYKPTCIYMLQLR